MPLFPVYDFINSQALSDKGLMVTSRVVTTLKNNNYKFVFLSGNCFIQFSSLQSKCMDQILLQGFEPSRVYSLRGHISVKNTENLHTILCSEG